MHGTRAKILISVNILLTWIAIGTVVFHRLESWTWIQSFYFSVVTVTTVGFGDFTPSTDISRLFTALYILVGVSIGVAALGVIGSEILRHREDHYIQKSSSAKK